MSVQYRLQITAIGTTPILMELGYYTRLTLSPNPTDWTVSQSTITLHPVEGLHIDYRYRTHLGLD